MRKNKFANLRKRQIRKIVDLALDINGMEERKQEVTGNLPTVFVEYAGHVDILYVRTCESGWSRKHPSYTREFEIKVGKNLSCYDSMEDAIKYLEELKRRVNK